MKKMTEQIKKGSVAPLQLGSEGLCGSVSVAPVPLLTCWSSSQGGVAVEGPVPLPSAREPKALT